jgi:hypothetical protein
LTNARPPVPAPAHLLPSVSLPHLPPPRQHRRLRRRHPRRTRAAPRRIRGATTCAAVAPSWARPSATSAWSSPASRRSGIRRTAMSCSVPMASSVTPAACAVPARHTAASAGRSMAHDLIAASEQLAQLLGVPRQRCHRRGRCARDGRLTHGAQQVQQLRLDALQRLPPLSCASAHPSPAVSRVPAPARLRLRSARRPCVPHHPTGRQISS